MPVMKNNYCCINEIMQKILKYFLLEDSNIHQTWITFFKVNYVYSWFILIFSVIFKSHGLTQILTNKKLLVKIELSCLNFKITPAIVHRAPSNFMFLFYCRQFFNVLMFEMRCMIIQSKNLHDCIIWSNSFNISS